MAKKKAKKKPKKKDYVEVPLDLPDEAILTLALQAHEQDITLNQHIVNILLKVSKRIIEDA